jgi:hypothetical protein
MSDAMSQACLTSTIGTHIGVVMRNINSCIASIFVPFYGLAKEGFPEGRRRLPSVYIRVQYAL